MKNFILIIICSFSFNIGIAQIDTTGNECSTPDIDTTEFKQLPWFDNNQFLENFLDSIGYPAAGLGNRIVEAPRVRFWIPVKFWIYRDDNGNGGPTQFEIQRMIDKLNRIYNQQNNSLIGFYMKCEPAFINNSQHLIKTFVGASLLMAANRDFGCFNVHVVDQLQFAVGLALKPLGACIVNRQTYLRDDNYTLPHEVGHLLGLIHTHIFWDWQIKCFKECVSRTRTWPTFNLCFGNRIRSKRVCESTGDGLSDTQADPRLLSNFTCNYTEVGSDLWGDSYTNPPNGPQESPNTHNVMSYQGLDACVDQFSRLQTGVMLYNLHVSNGANGAVWRNPIYTFDDFEPDNNADMAANRNITINQVQERNFHQQWNRIGVPVGYTTQCDVDWVRFVAPCTNSLTISTSAMPNRTNANTRLTIFNNTLTQLAQNDDIAPGNQFSGITFNFVSGQEYFIRIENMANLVTGYYNLQIGYTNPLGINGPNQFCTPTNYFIDNLPASATVTWGEIPSGIANLSCLNCLQTTLSKINNGTFTLTANVNSCGTTQTFTKPITVGGYINYQVQIQGPYMVPLNYVGSYSVDQNAYIGLSNLVWSWPAGWSYITGGNGSNYIVLRSPSTSSTGNINLSFSSCGINGVLATKWVAWGYGGSTYRVSPNPANDMLKIEQIDSSTKKALSQTGIQSVEIIDKMGLVAYKKIFAKGTPNGMTIPVGQLRNDVYTVRIFDGKEWKSYKTIIQH